MDPAEYVLHPFDENERLELDEILSRAAESLRVMLLEGLETAMNRYQRHRGKLILDGTDPKR
jgi:peptidyl-tRNA hydrolase